MHLTRCGLLTSRHVTTLAPTSPSARQPHCEAMGRAVPFGHHPQYQPGSQQTNFSSFAKGSGGPCLAVGWCRKVTCSPHSLCPRGGPHQAPPAGGPRPVSSLEITPIRIPVSVDRAVTGVLRTLRVGAAPSALPSRTPEPPPSLTPLSQPKCRTPLLPVWNLGARRPASRSVSEAHVNLAEDGQTS